MAGVVGEGGVVGEARVVVEARVGGKAGVVGEGGVVGEAGVVVETGVGGEARVVGEGGLETVGDHVHEWAQRDDHAYQYVCGAVRLAYHSPRDSHQKLSYTILSCLSLPAVCQPDIACSADCTSSYSDGSDDG